MPVFPGRYKLAFSAPEVPMWMVLGTAFASPTVDAAVAEAREYLATPFRWEGRATERLPGLDCLGLVFRAYGTATGTDWREYSVSPSKLVASGRLGATVPGLGGVLRADLDRSLLKNGDVLYLLLDGYKLDDDPLLVHGDHRYWPWHVGLYVDGGLVLNAHPSHGVVETFLDDIPWDALYVTRMP